MRIKPAGGAIALLAFIIVTGAPAAPAAVVIDSVSKQDGVQAELDAALATRPGGVQVSDNAVSWEGGNVIMVVPSPGQKLAPPGLGSGIRKGTLTTPLLEEQASLGKPTTRAARRLAAGVGSCPGGVFETDYYCFYVDRDFGGRRLQFTGATRAAYASNWGFDNQTSSWVSNDVDCWLTAKDFRPDQAARLWQADENSASSWVGNEANDRMSAWTCNP